MTAAVCPTELEDSPDVVTARLKVSYGEMSQLEGLSNVVTARARKPRLTNFVPRYIRSQPCLSGATSGL